MQNSSSIISCRIAKRSNSITTSNMRFVWSPRQAIYGATGTWMHWLIMLVAVMHMVSAIDPTPQPIGTALLTPDAIAAGNTGPNCSNVRSLFEKRQISANEVPTEPINDGLRFCAASKGSCCKFSTEGKLASLSRTLLDKSTKDAISRLSSILGTRATKFNEYFMQLLTKSKREFHDMFKRTYGVIYEQNSYVFSDLFNELENYYTSGKVDLAEEMDSFFNTLYQKMFTVLNSQYKFDDKYLGCVSEHMKELKPFGDVPDKLSVQIKRSFVATRTYDQALSAAADVARNMMTVRPTADCTAALMKMQHCGLCGGYAEKPCSNYCVNVMKGCLHYYAELDAEWDNFVASMEKVSERLLGPFNIVMVVEPINIKISEAIMNFQETGHDISQQVFQGCGKPQLGRRRRAISPRLIENEQRAVYFDDLDNFTFDEDGGIGGESLVAQQQPDDDFDSNRRRNRRSAAVGAAVNGELKFEPLKFSSADDDANADDDGAKGRNKNKNKNKKQQQSTGTKKDGEESDENKEPMMDKLIKDIRLKVKESKKFWTNLPFQVCNGEDYAMAVGIESSCWNGVNIDKYPHAISHDINSNPEFATMATAPRQNSLLAGQLFALKNAVGHLRNAYNGLDVEWNDVEEPYYGSGSGSGAGVDDEDDDSGSGLDPFEHVPRMPIDTGGGNNGMNGGAGSTGTTSTTHPNATVHHHDRDNTISTTDHDTNHHDGDSSSSGTATTNMPPMSIRRALLTYLFPIYMAWFGGLFCDLL